MNVVQPLAAIVLVVTLLGGALLLLKKRGAASFPGSGGRRLEVVERVSLGPQHSLNLVRADGKLLLVGTAPGCCQLLGLAVAGEEKA